MEKKVIFILPVIITVIIMFNYFSIFLHYQDIIYPTHKEGPIKRWVKQSLFYYFFIFRDYQDQIYPIHKEKPIKGWVKQEGVLSGQYKLEVTPWRELVIYFRQAYDEPDYQKARTDIYIEICTRKPYNKITIYEISCNNVILLENKDILIPGMGIVLGDDNKEIEIDGSAFYMLYRVYHYSWTNLVVGSINTKTFIDRKLGEKQSVFIKQIYSFDDEPIIEEIWEYRIVNGADNKLDLRPSTSLFF